MPFAVKDNIDVDGLPTTAACPAFAHTPAKDAASVARLLAAGAIVVGKSNLDQFATGLGGTRSPYGAPESVFGSDLISGGSSSGSEVAVASGTVRPALRRLRRHGPAGRGGRDRSLAPVAPLSAAGSPPRGGV